MLNERETPVTWRELAAAREFLGMTVDQVWIGYFGVGGFGSPADLERWLSGAAAIPPQDHDFLAQALNDQFTDRGLGYPVRYRRDVGPGD